LRFFAAGRFRVVVLATRAVPVFFFFDEAVFGDGAVILFARLFRACDSGLDRGLFFAVSGRILFL
jgi:hypothetical protein